MTTVEAKYRGCKEYHIVCLELITAARYRGTVTYQEIAQVMGLPLVGNYMGREVGHILGEISEDECDRGRPMLSAVAVGTSGMPGEGFFAFARQLGKFDGESSESRSRFWQQEKAAVYETWRRPLDQRPSKTD